MVPSNRGIIRKRAGIVKAGIGSSEICNGVNMNAHRLGSRINAALIGSGGEGYVIDISCIVDV